jgi:alkanesulfonate monooxygenase SsuD/methylene tetrahydromethanopterin reductase-like flavin-dependent oxidoreductase (luciferase family)
VAQQAEALGFDAAWFSDHIVIPREVRAAFSAAMERFAREVMPLVP